MNASQRPHQKNRETLATFAQLAVIGLLTFGTLLLLALLLPGAS